MPANNSEASQRKSNNLKVLNAITTAQADYVEGSITATQFAAKIAPLISEDFVFFCSYTPASELIRPLFAERRGVDGLLERYRLEQELETIEPGTTQPYDFGIADNAIYVSARETASFGDGPMVTFDIIFKFIFDSGLLRRIEMFVDGRPIDAAYPSQPT